MPTPIRAILASVVVAVVLGGAVLVWQRHTRPVFTSLEYSKDGLTWSPFEQPLWLWSQAKEARVRAMFSAPPSQPDTYSMLTSGRLDTLIVNGQDVTDIPHPGEPFLLGPLLVEGENSLEATMHNTNNPPFLSWSLTGTNSAHLKLLVLLCGAIGLCAYVCLRWTAASRTTASVLTLGIVVRLLYTLSTPEWVRSYDWEGHHEYVLYMLKFWAIPPAALGWETYQPPLFYVLAATVRGMLMAFGFVRYEALQLLPLWISVCVLVAGWKFSRLVWQEGSSTQFLFLMILAVFPGLVYQSSQISNDGLFTFFGILWIFFMTRFHISRLRRDWLWLSTVTVIALLTKSNALVLVAAQIASLGVLHLTTKRRVMLLSVLLAMVVIGSGWLFVLRFIIEQQSSIVGNVHLLPEILRVPQSAQTLLSFNPIQVIGIPFVNDIEDWSRRSYFWEYLFKSSLFGSHAFPALLNLCRLLTVSALTLFGLCIAGCVQHWKAERARLFLVVSAFLLGALFCFLWTYPMSSNQHFRFVAPLIVPMAWFAVSWQPKKLWLRQGAESIIIGFSLLSVLFFCLITTGSV